MLHFIAAPESCDWVEEMLADPDPEVRRWVAETIEQLVYSEDIESSELSELISLLEGHADAALRVLGAELRSQIAG